MATNIRSLLISGMYLQSGNGNPTHISPIASFFLDVDTPAGYISKGNGDWFSLSTSTSSGSTGFDVFVTGGTYSSGTATFMNNTGGTFSVTGFSTGSSGGTDTYVTGFTYLNNTFTINNNTGGTLSVLVNTMTGLTVNGVLSATTIYGTALSVTGITATTLTANTISSTTVSASNIFSGVTNLNTILDSKLIAVKITGHSTLSPADATTYFFGVNLSSPPQTIALVNKFSFPVDCTIKIATLEVRQAVCATTETSSIVLRENNTTDYTISGSVSNSFGTNSSTSKVITGLNIPILANNFYETKLMCPTWDTNPTGVIYTVTYYGY